MATTQKKSSGQRTSNTGGSKSSSSGKRTGSTAAKAKSGGSRKAVEPQHRPIRREVWAVICLFLALFAGFGYFNIEAVFIDFFCGLLKGLLGYGFWLMPPALLLCTYILAFHRGRPVRLRVFFALCLPLMFSCVVHGLMDSALPWDGQLTKTLWEEGQALTCGGVLGGVLAQFGVQVFSRLGSTIIYTLTFVLMGLGAFNRSIVDVTEWIFSRPRYEYEVEEIPERPRREGKQRPAVSEKTQAVQPVARASRAVIDIPVEDGPLVGKEPEPAPAPFAEKKKGSFFNRKSRVPAPDQLLTGGQSKEERIAENAEGSKPEPVPAQPPEPVPMEEKTVFAPVTSSAPVTQAPVVEPVSVAVSAVEPTPAVQPAPAPVPEITREPAVSKVKKAETEQAAMEIAQDIEANLTGDEHPYQYPPLSLLKESTGETGGQALGELNSNRQRLSDTIRSFGIDANIVNVVRGPSVTRYELELDQGVRLNKLTNLADDIALSLGATGVRIAPIPDKISVVGIEVPNKVVSPVSIHSVIGSKNFTDSKSKISFAVGKDISGECIIGDIGKLPHLLIAGTTGSGKSVCTNTIITSLLYKATPDEARLIMVDPKMVELGIYNGIPHLLIPVVTDPKKAAGALQWAVTEMMKRYRTFSEVGVRKLEEYNALAARTEGMEKMPAIVVIIDELADLMLVAAKEVEESIVRVAQMGRAAGMHLVIATQRPSADVITGLMKANIPSRIAFAVASAMESRIILDTQGAEKLVGRGDMLFAPLGNGKPTRVQGCFISDAEVASVVDFVKKNSGAAKYSDEVMHEIEQHAAEKDKSSKGVGGNTPDDVGGEYDELIDAATEVILETGQASVSMLQRRLKLGYARAARLVDQLEEKGIVGPFEGSKPRQLLITKEQWQEMQYRQNMAASGGYDAPSAPAAPVSSVEAGSDTPPFDVDEALDRAEEDTL